jgi:hypothetical protein
MWAGMNSTEAVTNDRWKIRNSEVGTKKLEEELDKTGLPYIWPTQTTGI